jgi:hypothetical protein
LKETPRSRIVFWSSFSTSGSNVTVVLMTLHIIKVDAVMMRSNQFPQPPFCAAGAG